MEQLRFDGRVALVTGVSTAGLGLAYARMLAAHGCRVVVNDYGVDWAGNPSGADTDEVVEILRGEGAEVHGVTGSVVTDAEEIVAAAVEAFGALDIVVNNAGAGGDFETLIDVHLHGSNRITQAAWEHLKVSGSGRVINVSSSGSYGSPGMPGYSAAKGGIISLTRTQGILGAEHGIGANVILPSAATRSTRGINTAGFTAFIEEFFPPEEVASFVTFLAHPSAKVNGQAFSVGGGLVVRVVQAANAGVSARGSSPADWAQQIDQVLESTDYTVAPTMWAHLGEFSQKLSPEAHAAFLSLGIDSNVAKKLGD